MNMKKYLSLVALAVAVAATSCSEDTTSGSAQYSSETTDVTLTASLDMPESRVGMNRKDESKASLYWHENDAISVFTKNATTNVTKNEKFTTTAKTGATTAEFSGKISNGAQLMYTAYPYNEKHTLNDDGTLTYILPSEYNYTTVESNIFPKDGTYPSNNTYMPMYGAISGDNNVAFTHLGGMIVIRIDKMPITEGTLTVTSVEKLCGKFEVILSDTPIQDDTQITTETASDDNGKVTFNFSNAKEGSAGVFYLPLATGDYHNFKVTLSDGKGYSQTEDYGTRSVSRTTITAISLESTLLKIDDHWFVDLGLPSGVLWATTNVGAETPTDCGDYYAWGETTTKEDYSEASYTLPALSKYYSTDWDQMFTLNAEDDAATVNWGKDCRMPTVGEFQELIDNCTWTETTLTNSNNESVSGVKFTSKTNGNSIFLPAGGLRYRKELPDSNSGIFYWSNFGNSYSAAYALSSVDDSILSGGTPYNGHSVRPVSVLKSIVKNGTLEDVQIGSLDQNWE